jgi:SAM-dependent methyltransferase
MKTVFRQTPLYRFLYYCCGSELEKTVLDCGAGGDCPPLALFFEHGFKTYGIEISGEQLKKARVFQQARGIELGILHGDMRALPFPDGFLCFAYSYNSIFHMKKTDMKQAVGEIKRVLKPGGLCYINFLSIKDCGCGRGEKAGEGEYLQDEDDSRILHAYLEEEEADEYFAGMNIIYKENRTVERMFEGEWIRQGYIDYIARKQDV